MFELLINKDVWNGLSESQKMVIEITCKAATADAFAYTEAIQGGVIRENVEKRGVTPHCWSDEMLASFRQAWQEVAKELSADRTWLRRFFAFLRTEV